MAWDYFPLDLATLPTNGLQDHNIWKELEDAINERDLVLGGAGNFKVYGSAADDWLLGENKHFEAAHIAAVQQKVLDLAIQFVNHTDNSGDWRGISSSSENGPLWTLNSIFTYAGLNINGFTRKYGTSPSGITTAYGLCNTDDFIAIYKEDITLKIAEWVNELYYILDLLRWTKLTPSSLTSGTEYSLIEFPEGLSEDTVWNELVALWPPTGVEGPYFACCLSELGSQKLGEEGIYYATAEIQDGKLSVADTLPLAPYNYKIDWYVVAIEVHLVDPDPNTYTFEFDDDGLPLEGLDVYSVLETTTSDTMDFYYPGSATLQDRPSTVDPPVEGIWTIHTKGWYLNQADAIVKWNVVGGLTKVSETV